MSFATSLFTCIIALEQRWRYWGGFPKKRYTKWERFCVCYTINATNIMSNNKGLHNMKAITHLLFCVTAAEFSDT